MSIGLLPKRIWRKLGSALQRELLHERCDSLQLRDAGGSADGRFFGRKKKKHAIFLWGTTRVPPGGMLSQKKIPSRLENKADYGDSSP